LILTVNHLSMEYAKNVHMELTSIQMAIVFYQILYVKQLMSLHANVLSAMQVFL